MKSNANGDKAADRHVVLDMVDGSEHIKLIKTEHGSECTIFVKKTLDIVELRQSQLEKLEEQMETNTTSFDFLDKIDAEIMQKKKRTEKVDLYMTDYEEIELEDFDGVKGGDMLYFKSTQRHLKTLKDLKTDMDKFDLSVKKFYGKSVTRKRSGDDGGIKDGFIDRMDDDIENVKRRKSSDDFELQYGNTFAVKQHLNFDKPPSPPVCPPVQCDVNLPLKGDKKVPGHSDVNLPGQGDEKVLGQGDVNQTDQGNKKVLGQDDEKVLGQGDEKVPGQCDVSQLDQGDEKVPGEGDVNVPGHSDVNPLLQGDKKSPINKSPIHSDGDGGSTGSNSDGKTNTDADAGSQTSNTGFSNSSGEEGDEFSEDLDESKGSACKLVINGEEIR